MTMPENTATDGANAKDTLLRMLDEHVASIDLAAIPRPRGSSVGAAEPGIAVFRDLAEQVVELRTRAVSHRRQQARWLAEAERAVRRSADEEAKEALGRYSEHGELAVEAEAMLAECQAMVETLRRAIARASGIVSG